MCFTGPLMVLTLFVQSPCLLVRLPCLHNVDFQCTAGLLLYLSAIYRLKLSINDSAYQLFIDRNEL